MMEKEITEEFLDTWSTMVPKILDISNDNDCLGLRDFLEVYLPDEISDGKYNIIHEILPLNLLSHVLEIIGA